jgi:hypothetical protein
MGTRVPFPGGNADSLVDHSVIIIPKDFRAATIGPVTDTDLHGMIPTLMTFIPNSIKLIPFSRALLEKLIVTQLVKKFPAFYGTSRFLPCSQQPATGPYSKTDASSPHPILILS